MTFKQLQRMASLNKMTVNRTVDGEFKLNFSGNSEETAYFSDDLDDLYGTMKDMLRRADRAFWYDLDGTRRQF